MEQVAQGSGHGPKLLELKGHLPCCKNPLTMPGIGHSCGFGAVKAQAAGARVQCCTVLGFDIPVQKAEGIETPVSGNCEPLLSTVVRYCGWLVLRSLSALHSTCVHPVALRMCTSVCDGQPAGTWPRSPFWLQCCKLIGKGMVLLLSLLPHHHLQSCKWDKLKHSSCGAMPKAECSQRANSKETSPVCCDIHMIFTSSDAGYGERGQEGKRQGARTHAQQLHVPKMDKLVLWHGVTIRSQL